MTFEVGRCLLRDILKRKKIDRQTVCRDLGMGAQQLSDYINKHRVMSLPTAKMFAVYFNVHIDDLYEFREVNRKAGR